MAKTNEAFKPDDDILSIKESTKTSSEKEKSVPFFSLYKYTTKHEKLLLLLLVFLAAVQGCCIPVLFVVFGRMTDDYVDSAAIQEQYGGCHFACKECLKDGSYIPVDNSTDPCLCDSDSCEFYNQFLPMDDIFADNTDLSKCFTDPTFAISERDYCLSGIEYTLKKELTDSQVKFCIYYAIAGFIVIIAGFIHAGGFTYISQKSVRRMRIKFYRSLMSQSMQFFDENPATEFNSRINDDISYIKDGTGDKVSQAIVLAVQGFAGLCLGLYYSWQLGLLIIGVSPVLGFCAFMLMTTDGRVTKIKIDSYAKASAIAEEVMRGLRTVHSFGGQKLETYRYVQACIPAKMKMIKATYLVGLFVGILYFFIFILYAITFSFGTFLYTKELVTPGAMMTTFFGVLIGAFSIAQSTANLQAFSEAKSAAYRVFEIIDMKSKINAVEDKKPKLENRSKKGVKVELKDVNFAYPMVSDRNILKKLNLKINPGDTTALVGASGCGKSTVMALVQRLYDPDQGNVLIDDQDLKKVSVKSLRNDIGIVSQEPILFGTTIYENIKFGKQNCTKEDVETAAKIANAHEFIMQLPKQYDTFVGSKGAQLSGGQKQRIAIARAVIKKPKLLLLDEATSALDANSEKEVQLALNKISKDCTTIIIAHRLSTIRNADVIYVMNEGRLVEQGTHEELFSNEKGIYNALVNAQKHGALKDQKEEIKDGLPKYTTAISKTEDSQEKLKKDASEEVIPDTSIWKMFAMNKPEWKSILLGSIAAAVAGTADPLNAVLFSEILTVYTIPPGEDTNSEIWSQVLPYVYLWLGLSFGAGLAHAIRTISFSYSGMNLVERIREKYFEATINQDISYFDSPHHTPGVICSRLSQDCQKAGNATGIQLGLIIQNFSAMGTAIVIGFIFSWELTLLLFVLAPLMALAGAIEFKYAVTSSTAKDLEDERQNEDNKNSVKELSNTEQYRKWAYESFSNMRTVQMLNIQEIFIQNFNSAVKKAFKDDKKFSVIRGASYAFSQSMVFFVYSATFRFGLYLITERNLEFENLYKVVTAIIFSAMAVGQNMSLVPNYAEAKISANRIFYMFTRTPEIDARNEWGEKDIPAEKISLTDVDFTYPARPEVKILKSISLGEYFSLIVQVSKHICLQKLL